MAAAVRAAAVQMPCSDRSVALNLRRMEAALARLARRRVRLAVFPECCLSGYLVRPAERDWPAIEAGVERIRRRARALRMAVIFGAARRRRGGGRPFNSALAVDGRGRLLARYDKCHLMPADEECFSPGRRLPRVFRLAGLRLAMQVCFDARFPEPARLAALAGAELLVYLFAGFGADAWKLPVIEGHLRSRAAENGVHVLAANRRHRVMIAASRIVDPDGLDLAAARAGRSAEIVADLRPARAGGGFLRRRRPDLYSLRRT